MTSAFTFDARFCSGCKACQAACKDKNNLPLGVLWRRVIEVSGGGWQRSGEAWNNTVFAYNFSLACNHCMYPKCAGVCPAGAYEVRDDGIVLLDTEKCMGCGYCSWACPYGAPQYNAETGTMSKCNLCFDNLEQGLPPACVAACPMRVLDYKEVTADQREMRLWDAPSETHPFPLPVTSHTQPRLAIQQHAAMNALQKKFVANLEEIQPHLTSIREDVPLILFTLLIQMAVGGFWVMTWLANGATSLLSSLLVGVCLGVGVLISFTHLGTKSNAWRAVSNLRKSRLSREILFMGLFAVGWLFSTLTVVIRHYLSLEWMAFTSVLGIGLIHNMAEVYRLPAAPGWNTWRTNVGFMSSALLLGLTFVSCLQRDESNILFVGVMIMILLLVQLVLIRRQTTDHLLENTRIGLIIVGFLVAASSLIRSELNTIWIICLLLLIVVEETVGRWLFYRSRR